VSGDGSRSVSICAKLVASLWEANDKEMTVVEGCVETDPVEEL